MILMIILFAVCSDEQHDNRMILLNLMEVGEFKNYAGEWWHYTLQNEPFPDTYFDFPIQRDCGC
jgi:zinc D-Ala-D-Ala dipeptidase